MHWRTCDNIGTLYCVARGFACGAHALETSIACSEPELFAIAAQNLVSNNIFQNKYIYIYIAVRDPAGDPVFFIMAVFVWVLPLFGKLLLYHL